MISVPPNHNPPHQILTNSFASLGVEGKGSWILDSGATDHVAICFSWFSSYVPMQDYYVHFLDKTVVPVTHIGIVTLSEDLILYDVLFVPKFTYNLIFTRKLTAASS